MKPLTLLLCLLLALPAAAEDAPSLDTARATVLTPAPDSRTVEVGAGCWLREDVCMGAGKRAARLEAERKPDAPLVLVAGAFAAGVALGLALAQGQRADAAGR